MADFLDAKRDELRARLAELAPLVAEHDRLKRALEALDAVDGSASATPSPVPTPTGGSAKAERPKGRPQRTERSRPRAVPSPEAAAPGAPAPTPDPAPPASPAAASVPRADPAPAPPTAASAPRAAPDPAPAADANGSADASAPSADADVEPTTVEAVPPVGAAGNGSSFDEDWDAPAPVGRPIVVDPPDEDERDAALRVLREEPGLQATEIARRIGLPPHDAYRILPGLEEAGLATKQGRGWHPTGA